MKKTKFDKWFEKNRNDLEVDFISSFPDEDQPLDDDTPDFMNNWADCFEGYAKEVYKIKKNNK